MGGPTEDFFAHVTTRELPAPVRRVSGSIRIDLLHDGPHHGQVDHWLVRLADGNLSVRRENQPADCVLTLTKENFDKLVTGKNSLNVMLPRADLRLEGSLHMLTVIRYLLPGPPNAVDPRDLARSGRRA